jgi:death on curing protein
VNEPLWVDEATALAIHRRQLAEHGGGEGVRDPGLLSSALARPRNRYAYGESADVAVMAAAYAHGIIINHPFVDGNKRTGYVVARLLLVLNGHDIEATQDEKYLTFLAVAAGDVSEQGLAEWLRERLVRRLGEST